MTRIIPSSAAYAIVLGALSAIPPLSIDMALPGLSGIESELDGARNQGALALGLFLLGFAVSPLAAGPLLDRYGRRPMLLVGLTLMALGAAGCAWATDFNTLLAFRLLQGAGAGVCVVIPVAMVRDVFDGVQARAKLAQITAALGMAPIVAPIVGGVVMEFAGWRTIFGLQALAGIVLLLVTAVGIEESLQPQHRRSVAPHAVLAGYKEVLRDSAFRNFTLIFAFAFACMFSYIACSWTIFVQEFGYSEQVFSLIFAATAAGTLLGFITSSRLTVLGVSSTALLSVGVVGMVCMSLLIFFLSLLDQLHPWAIAPAVAVALMCFGLIAPNATHEAMRSLPHLAGAAAGLSRSVQMGMGSLASALAAVTLLHVRSTIAMSLLMSIFAALALLVLLLARRRATSPTLNTDSSG